VLAGLSAAHVQGIVHCDLKPANVLVTHPRPDSPLLKIVDFGTARAVQAAAGNLGRDVVVGSPMYMAPEQVAGEHVDFRTDVYQATALLFAMLAGTDPFAGASSREVMKLVAKGKRKNLRALVPELPEELLEVVADGMGPKPGELIQSTEELAERLRPFVSSARAASLAPQDATRGARSCQLVVGRTSDVTRDSGLPIAGLSSVIPVHMRRVARMTDSLLMSPRIPRAASTPKLRVGRDFMPLPNDPQYRELVQARGSATHVSCGRSSFRRDVMPALLATGFGFGMGVILAWSAGLL
jgi:serine/threonine protein kinase